MSWEILYGVGALLLLAALIYGFTQNKRRNRANDAITEKATHDIYVKPTEEYREEREALKDQLRPS